MSADRQTRVGAAATTSLEAMTAALLSFLHHLPESTGTHPLPGGWMAGWPPPHSCHRPSSDAGNRELQLASRRAPVAS